MKGQSRRVGDGVSERDVGYGTATAEDSDSDVASAGELHDGLDDVGAGGDLKDDGFHGEVAVLGDDDGGFWFVF